MCDPGCPLSRYLPDKVELTPHQRKGIFDVVCVSTRSSGAAHHAAGFPPYQGMRAHGVYTLDAKKVIRWAAANAWALSLGLKIQLQIFSAIQ
jgi:hypothetical protein